jgi:hypothetical protein
MAKQYLMMTDESGMELMQKVFSNLAIRYLEVQGMNMQGGGVNILVTPILPPVTPMAPLPVPESLEGNAPEVAAD